MSRKTSRKTRKQPRTERVPARRVVRRRPTHTVSKTVLEFPSTPVVQRVALTPYAPRLAYLNTYGWPLSDPFKKYEKYKSEAKAARAARAAAVEHKTSAGREEKTAPMESKGTQYVGRDIVDLVPSAPLEEKEVFPASARLKSAGLKQRKRKTPLHALVF